MSQLLRMRVNVKFARTDSYSNSIFFISRVRLVETVMQYADERKLTKTDQNCPVNI